MEPRTLKEIVNDLSNLLEASPELADLPVVTSIDDEGNGFNKVYFTPSAGVFEENSFTSDKSMKPNTVCLN